MTDIIPGQERLTVQVTVLHYISEEALNHLEIRWIMRQYAS